ncbi:MAG: inorganic diphosphatase [Ferruginibacter sp.]|nr:inorganic diphosphatase [Ferruginibacter sp.]
MTTYNVTVETVKGSNVKYKFDEALGMFMVKKILPDGMVFPFDFGFLPGTKGEDGDPLDVMLISEFSCYTGTMVQCRLVAALTALQNKDAGKALRNDRFFMIPLVSRQFAHVKTIRDLPGGLLNQLSQFFINYNQLEDKIFKPLEFLEEEQAASLIINATV